MIAPPTRQPLTRQPVTRQPVQRQPVNTPRSLDRSLGIPVDHWNHPMMNR